MIFKMFKKLLPMSIKKQMVNFYILAVKYGQFKSIKRWDCVNKEDENIPWYTYPAIEYLNNIDFSQKVIFEYGSGNSSTYWASRAKAVYSVEDNKSWYEKIKTSLVKNQTIYLCENESDYLQAINKVPSKIDVVIIDGVYREECAKLIKGRLSDLAIVILDNSDWYKEASRYFREELDLIEIDFHGFGPINNYTWTTSIFFARNVKLTPVDNLQPNYSIAGIKSGDEKFN